MSFGALTQLYMDDCRSRLRKSTYNNKEYLINTKILPIFKDMQLASVNATTIRTWQNGLLNNDPPLEPTYIKTINNQLNAILNYAVRFYGLKENPAHKAGSVGKGKAGTMLFWTEDEFLRFIPVVKDKPASYVMFNILYYAGIREGELLALTLDDFDFSTNTLSINKSYANVRGLDVIGPPKTPKSIRTISIPPFLMDIVKNYASRLVDYKSTDRLFLCSKSHLAYEMRRGCRSSGVKVIRIHDLRHSHAAYLIEHGFSPKLIQERLGHENIETTLGTYGHLYPGKQAEVATYMQDCRTKSVLKNQQSQNNSDNITIVSKE